jgi:chromosome segregation ATPase
MSALLHALERLCVLAATGTGDPYEVAAELNQVAEEIMATDREQEVELGQTLGTLNTKVDGLTAKVDGAVTDLAALRTQQAELVAKLEEARADDVELSDEIALARSIETKIDAAAAKLTTPTEPGGGPV